jgi:DNA-binding NtrC family response regulator
MAIATNTSPSPSQLQIIVPDIKAHYPQTPIIVLSGYYPDEFVIDLKQKGINRFLKLPFLEDDLIKEVERLLDNPIQLLSKAINALPT